MVGHVEIGIRYYGKTEAIGKEAVYTSFLVIGIPLVPTGSWYGVRYGNMCERITGRRIRWNFRSAFLGYLRWFAIAAPIIVFCYASPNGNRADWDVPLLVLSGILAAMYAGLHFILIKASDRETRQRLLLHQILQSTVNPDWLTPTDCERVMSIFRPILDSLQIPVAARQWELGNPDSELAPFVYAMARYMQPLEPTVDWDAIALRIWSLMESSGVAERLSAVGPD